MKARNIGLLLMIAVGLYGCGGGSDSSMSSTPPTSSMPPPSSSAPPPPADFSVGTVETLVSAKDETSDPLMFDNGAVLTPSGDETSDPTTVNGQ